MKILVPLNNMDHLEAFIEAGADEFYIGFQDKAWEDKFGDYQDINRMTGFKELANRYDFNQLLDIIDVVKTRGLKLYITFNSPIYTQEQLEYLMGYFIQLRKKEVDGIIVSCIELVDIAKEIGIPSVISTIGGVYNSDISRYYCEHGAFRIILPRDLSIREMEDITKKEPGVEYEVFMMRNGCIFSDSNCLGLHRKGYYGICYHVKHADKEIINKAKTFEAIHDVELNNTIYSHAFHEYACGLCSIYDFVKMGITVCKIVGRYEEWREIYNDITSVKKNIELAKKCNSQEEYLQQMFFPEGRGVMCKLGLSCYYPESRF